MTPARSAKPRKPTEAAITAWALAAALLGIWVWYASQTPRFTAPVPAMPTHNAFNVFVAAANAEAQSRAVDYAANGGPVQPGPANVSALVAANTPALRLLRQGLLLSYQNPPLRSLTANTSYYGAFRGLGRLLKLEGRAREARGDWAGASSSALDAVQMGLMIPRGSSLIGTLSGASCQAEGRRLLWAELPCLSAAQCAAAAHRLEAIQSLQVSYAATIQEEEWENQAILLEILRAPNWYSALLQDTVGGQGMGMSPERGIRLLLTSKGAIFNDYTRLMAQEIRNASLPYAANPPPPAPPSDPISALFMPDYRLGQFRVTDGETQNALLTVALALRAYRLGHGAYPPTLNALAPAYLFHVPADPFALSGPLRYKRFGKGCVLYSVGPDGRDDGGRPISGATPYSHYSRPGDRGDIVAGVNLF